MDDTNLAALPSSNLSSRANPTEFDFVKAEKISLRGHTSFNERWVQERIAEDPVILGLGDLILKDKERRQPRAGRLDLLLQDAESNRRFEVEVQLGKTDESHIIRTIEYWDIERKRYPQYEHCAVIVAEEITARFLNVIGLFNGYIPFIALQISAFRLDNKMTLIFTKVVDELTLGLVDEDEEIQEVTDRAYWEQRGAKATVAMADQVLELIREFDTSVELKYNKRYIGLSIGGQPNNFVTLKAKKKHLNVAIRLEESNEVSEMLDNSALDVMDYDKRTRRYRLRLTKPDFEKEREPLTKLLKFSYDSWTS